MHAAMILQTEGRRGRSATHPQTRVASLPLLGTAGTRITKLGVRAGGYGTPILGRKFHESVLSFAPSEPGRTLILKATPGRVVRRCIEWARDRHERLAIRGRAT